MVVSITSAMVKLTGVASTASFSKLPSVAVMVVPSNTALIASVSTYGSTSVLLKVVVLEL